MMEYVLLLAQATAAVGGQWLHRAEALWPRSLHEAWDLLTSWPGLAVTGGTAALLVAARRRRRRHEATGWRFDDEAMQPRLWRS